jgi:hypothetical protein
VSHARKNDLGEWVLYTDALAALAAAAPTAQPQPQPEPNAEDAAVRICNAVAELGDRNSPEDWPEAMLVTHAELHAIVLDALATPAPAAQQPAELTDAARDVLAERARQIAVEGWSPAHDDATYSTEELAFAASCYATADEGDAPPAVWPFPWVWWKPKDRRRNLIKAGALTLAEIERLDRAAIKAQGGSQ